MAQYHSDNLFLHTSPGSVYITVSPKTRINKTYIDGASEFKFICNSINIEDKIKEAKDIYNRCVKLGQLNRRKRQTTAVLCHCQSPVGRDHSWQQHNTAKSKKA